MSGREPDGFDVLAVGDVHLNRPEPATAFSKVGSLFDRMDLRIGNLEGPLSTACDLIEMNMGASLRSPPEMIEGITEAGFDVVSHANNHAMDYGAEALVDTLDLLDHHGITYVGAGRTLAEAERIKSVTVDGTDIGLLSFDATTSTWSNVRATAERPGINKVKTSPLYPDPHVSELDFERVTGRVSSAADRVDVLLAMLHCGVSIHPVVTTAQRAIAKGLIDAGVDAVIGHHPHTIQAIDVYRGAPIIYSLGNFVFDALDVMGTLPTTRTTGAVQLEVTEGAISTVRFYPMWINDDGQPDFADPEAENFSTIADLSMREGTKLNRYADHFAVSTG